MSLSCTVSEIDSEFKQKSQNFLTPIVFCTPTERVPLGIGAGAGGQKTRMMGLPGWERSLTISSALWIECTKVM